MDYPILNYIMDLMLILIDKQIQIERLRIINSTIHDLKEY